MGPGNCVHIRRCSHLWGVHNERFHCILIVNTTSKYLNELQFMLGIKLISFKYFSNITPFHELGSKLPDYVCNSDTNGLTLTLLVANFPNTK